ncbi:hypothetical protein AC579_6033 [Pseudocercospora musae]|uniref:Uncharacterized protein n=1 Tax=Pseudocercospora musae TaxID=113226 RepID=A0A139IF78_9PEZI|nr:hypothetical protein AC579_6033 [Pseudocercospora musae]
MPRKLPEKAWLAVESTTSDSKRLKETVDNSDTHRQLLDSLVSYVYDLKANPVGQIQCHD